MPLDVEIKPVEYPVVGAHVYEVFYNGWHGARICGWYLVPDGSGPFPVTVHYHGYSGAKGEIYRYLMWALQGYAVFAVDVRGQSGSSTDPVPYSGGHVTGWMTLGILDPQETFYRGVYVDCVRALDFVCSRPEVDGRRIAIMGMSQGGGLTLAVAALDHRPVVALPEMPYLCHYRRAVQMAMRPPYLEISNYIRTYPQREAQVWRTLSYVDNLNLAPWIKCPVLMNVGLLDDVCPPSTIYAVFNKIPTRKEMRVYPFHNHEVPEAHWEDKLRWTHYYLRGSGRL